MTATLCITSIKEGIRQFGTYDPFDKSYAMDFVNSPNWATLDPQEASTFTGEVLQAVKEWMEKVEYPEDDVKEVTQYFARNFAMDWDEAQYDTDHVDEGLIMENYQTFVKHDPRILEIDPNLVNGY